MKLYYILDHFKYKMYKQWRAWKRKWIFGTICYLFGHKYYIAFDRIGVRSICSRCKHFDVIERY